MDYKRSKKVVYLQKELRNSIRLIELGFGEIQSIDLNNNFYHLPLQLLASGFERFLKCYICIEYFEKEDVFPSFNMLKKTYGHNIFKMKEQVYDESDTKLDEILKLLSSFGKDARYYNLNFVVEDPKLGKNVEEEWEKIENEFLKENDDLYEKYENLIITDETYKFINFKVISVLEKFIRRLSRNIKNGDIGILAEYFVGEVFDFAVIQDENLGKKDYKNITKKVIRTNKKPHKRTRLDENERHSSPNYLSMKIEKAEFDGEWPFESETVIIELRDRNRCVITIEGYDYALNSRAYNAYDLELVTNANMTIPGTSVNDFIQLTLKLERN